MILQQGTQPAQGSRPQFVQKPTIRQSGQAVIIECQLTADPSPSVSWFHNNLPIQQSSRLLQDMRSEEYVHQISLQISQVTLQDGGEYRAVARNTLGEATATITLNFEGERLLFPLEFKPSSSAPG